jgi:hypothetical protein
LVDTALQNQVLDQAADRIIGEGSHNRGIQAKAASQPASDVVFSATFGNCEVPGRPNAAVTGIEAQHHFAECDQVPTAILSGFNI